MSKCLNQLLLSIRPWSAGGHDSSVEACDYRLCVFGNRDGPVFCLSAALAGGAGVMLSSCFSSSTWVWLPSLVSLPAISLSPYLAFSLFSLSLSLFLCPFLSFSLTLGTAPLPDHLGLSSTKVCVCWCKCLCMRAHADRHVWARVWVSPREGIYVYVYVCVFGYVCVSVSASAPVCMSVFMRVCQ